MRQKGRGYQISETENPFRHSIFCGKFKMAIPKWLTKRLYGTYDFFSKLVFGTAYYKSTIGFRNFNTSIDFNSQLYSFIR